MRSGGPDFNLEQTAWPSSQLAMACVPATVAPVKREITFLIVIQLFFKDAVLYVVVMHA